MGRLEDVEVNIDGVRIKTNFEVIKMEEDKNPYPELLGLEWAFKNKSILNLKYN